MNASFPFTFEPLPPAFAAQRFRGMEGQREKEEEREESSLKLCRGIARIIFFPSFLPAVSIFPGRGGKGWRVIDHATRQAPLAYRHEIPVGRDSPLRSLLRLLPDVESAA